MLDVSIQALYDYKVVIGLEVTEQQGFQFKHCTIIRSDCVNQFSFIKGFQFKHCTIIRKPKKHRNDIMIDVSIQALYDYKTFRFRPPYFVV